FCFVFFFQAEDGIRDGHVTGVQTCALPISQRILSGQAPCNNLCDTAPDPKEYAARNQANIAWMKGTFASAEAHNSAAVMFIAQEIGRASCRERGEVWVVVVGAK